MVFGSKIEECYETVIAALAAQIERLEIEAEMKAQENRRLAEENLALRAEIGDIRERHDRLDRKLGEIEKFCAEQSTAFMDDAMDNVDKFVSDYGKPLYKFRSRPTEFIRATRGEAQPINPDTTKDPFNGAPLA